MAGPGNTTALAQLLVQFYDEPFETLQNNESSFIKMFPRTTFDNNVKRWHIDANDTNPIWSYASASMLDDPRAHLATDGVGTATFFLAPNVHSVVEASISPRFMAQALMMNGEVLESCKGKPGAFKNALKREQDKNLKDFWRQINTQVMDFTSTTSGNTGLNVDGLGVVLNAAGTTYANVNYGTYPEFKPYVNANAGTPRALSLALMQDVKNALEGFTTSINRQANVDKIFCNQIQFTNYGNLLQAQRRYVDIKTLDGGFQQLEFEGVPVVKVPGFNTTKMLFASTKSLAGSPSFEYAVLRNFKVEDKSQQVTDGILFVETHYANFIAKGRMQQGILADLS